VFVTDTNVLVSAAEAGRPEHQACFNLLERARIGREPWHITWSIVYEFLSVITNPRALEHPWPISKAWEFMAALLESPGLTVLTQTQRHAEIAAQLARETPGLQGSLLHDAHIAAIMREHGIRRIYTRDMHFHHFPFLEVIDPLRSS
jgi:toxin-antitoxin system PIN domain toxin